jgi:phytoene dehydrogenase-like protein
VGTLADVTTEGATSGRYDVVVVGGGHNALVAAAYLGRAGLSVRVLERGGEVGGAAVSGRVFAGVEARLSRYSYLVSLLPDRIVADLGLRVALRSRPVASFTPVRRGGEHRGLLVERAPGPATAASFRTLTGGDAEYAAWRAFYGQAEQLARAVAPTLLAPLLPADEARRRMGGRLWDRFVARPLGEAVEADFHDDTVRGVVLTDALIGTFASAHEPDLRQNRCFLYHVVGNGTGEWRVPVGGMGAVTAELARVARESGAELVTGAEVVGVAVDGHGGEVTYRHDGSERVVAARYVLAGVAPAVLDRLRGLPGRSGPMPEGAQMKINMVLDRLPRLRSGHDPAVAFAGTLHVDEGYTALADAHEAASAGTLPDPLPGEVYCHTLTDPTILAPDLAARGVHTLTLFGLHTPARLFTAAADAAGGTCAGATGALGAGATGAAGAAGAARAAGAAGAVRDEAVRRHLAGLDAHLVEPIADCLARDADGHPCLEAVSPRDLEAGLGLPGGHIFHGDLSWPWADDQAGPDGEPGAWGVETDVANLFTCGAGARRGGGVSGIGGHNAAMAILTHPH